MEEKNVQLAGTNSKHTDSDILNDTKKKGNITNDVKSVSNGSLSLNDLDPISSMSGKDHVKKNSSNTFEPVEVGFVKVPKNSYSNNVKGSNDNVVSRRSAKHKQKESEYELDLSECE